MGDPLDNIRFISIRELKPRMIGEFLLDPDILIPIEIADSGDRWDRQSVAWEAIVSGMLKFLAYRPEAEHNDYYRRFILAVKPDLKEEFTQAGIMKSRRGELELAVEIFRALAGVFPECASTRNNLALVYEQLSRKSEAHSHGEAAEQYLNLAFEAYKRSVEIDPGLAGTHYNFAHFYLRQNNYSKAREHFEQFLACDPESERSGPVRELLQQLEGIDGVERVCSQAFDAINLSREPEAVALLQKLVHRRPDIWNAWFLLGWAYRRLGEYHQGRQALEKAHALKPGDADTLNELAICLMEVGDYPESHRRLSEAVRLEPENPKLTSNLGIVALKMGRPEEARRHFEAVLARNPGDPLAKEYLRRLSAGQA